MLIPVFVLKPTWEHVHTQSQNENRICTSLRVNFINLTSQEYSKC